MLRNHGNSGAGLWTFSSSSMHGWLSCCSSPFLAVSLAVLVALQLVYSRLHTGLLISLTFHTASFSIAPFLDLSTPAMNRTQPLLLVIRYSLALSFPLFIFLSLSLSLSLPHTHTHTHTHTYTHKYINSLHTVTWSCQGSQPFCARGGGRSYNLWRFQCWP
jgi:hypothetical protein